MTNLYKHAKTEFEVLEKTTPDTVLKPFKKEILKLCEAVGNSGQSGGSIFYTKESIIKCIDKLLDFSPLTYIMGTDDEWKIIPKELRTDTGIRCINKRCNTIFKYSNNKCEYIEAIIWYDNENDISFSGSVYVDKTLKKMCSSSQYIKSFPFMPKKFFIDTENIYIDENDAINNNIHYYKDNDGCYYKVIKNPKILNKVFEYYDENVIS